MPIYEYQCEECGVRFERMQHMSADPLDTCPECSGQIHRVISPAGIIFKGSGFYVTDNRKSSSGRSQKKTSPSTTDTSSKESSNGSSSQPSDSASTPE